MVRPFGTRLWAAKEPLPDHRGEFTRYRLVCKRVDHRGRVAYETRDAGLGDVTVIRDAATFEIGSTITYEGLDHLVLADLGGSIEAGVPKHTSKTKGGDVIRIPGTNVRVISKADLALATM
jgi:hypothetical protein